MQIDLVEGPEIPETDEAHLKEALGMALALLETLRVSGTLMKMYEAIVKQEIKIIQKIADASEPTQVDQMAAVVTQAMTWRDAYLENQADASTISRQFFDEQSARLVRLLEEVVQVNEPLVGFDKQFEKEDDDA